MKTVFSVLVTALISTAAMADQPSEQMRDVTRALINNSGLVAQLDKRGTEFMTDVKVTMVQQGKYQYDLVFGRQCECPPLYGKVSIFEDRTPSFADGPFEYKISIEFDSQR
jgi:hypothetical protein